MREAISHLRNPSTAAKFSNHDLQLLWQAGYRDLRDLQDAAAEHLEASGLPWGSNLKPATSGETCQALRSRGGGAAFAQSAQR